jgi:hypothetical protein
LIITDSNPWVAAKSSQNPTSVGTVALFGTDSLVALIGTEKVKLGAAVSTWVRAMLPNLISRPR